MMMLLNLSMAVFTHIITLTNNKVFAYLDPGSGSYLWQLILAAILSSLFLIKVYWKKIISFFRGEKTSQPDKDQDRVDDE